MSQSRYLAIAGPSERLARLLCDEARFERLCGKLSLRARNPGFLLFADAGTEIVPIADRGWAIGRLFRRSDGSRIARVKQGEAERAAATDGGWLLESCWGSYAALLLTREGSVAIREPSGAVPLYAAAPDGLQLYFSSAQYALDTGLLASTPDPVMPLHWLAYPYLRTGRTALAGVREILPGARRRTEGIHNVDEGAWTPWAYSAPALQIRDFEVASAILRDTLLNTIQVLAADRRSVLVELSGGLDSAIVGASLRHSGIPFTAANFVTLSPDGDERRYASAAATRFSAPLTEIFEEETPVDLSVPAEPSLLPGLSPLVMPLHRAFTAHAESAGADVFFTGAGGDNIFCYLTTAAPILDAWQDLGWREALVRTARDTAELNGCTWWTAVAIAAAKAGRRRPAWKRQADFLNEEAVPPLDRHPWLDAPAQARPGQREHVAALLRIQHFLDPEIRATSVESVHPLMSQPLLELCLRIPSWLWTRGGRNRAVARDALSDLIPAEILGRRTKGRLEGMCARTFMRSRREVAGLLLDGRLAARGWLDRPALESYLRTEGEPPDVRYFRVFELAATELWLASWGA